ncbi:MAG TPA: hypothetical protein PKZ75_03960 [Bacteroidia bacterium]|nr:hypothetical protein [Bacteroidia bacterium]
MKKSTIFFCSIISVFAVIRCGNSGTLKHSESGLDSVMVSNAAGNYFYNENHNKWHADLGGFIINNSKYYDYKDFEAEVIFLKTGGEPLYTKKIKFDSEVAVPNSRCFVLENINIDFPINLSHDTAYKISWKLLKATPVLRSAISH